MQTIYADLYLKFTLAMIRKILGLDRKNDIFKKTIMNDSQVWRSAIAEINNA